MRYPERLGTFINNLAKAKDNVHCTTYYETVEMIRNKITLRMFAIRYGKKDEIPLVKEVYRENEQDKWINTDFYFMPMAGWRVCWEKKNYSYYGEVTPFNKLEKYKGNKPGVWVIHGWTYREIRELDESLKYLVVSNKTSDDINIMEYIKRFREYPSLELLGKAGFDYLYTDSRVLKLKGEKKKKFYKFLLANKKEVNEFHPKYNLINDAIKHDMSYQEYMVHMKIVEFGKEASENGFEFSYNECKDILKYIKKQQSDLHLYIDYLIMAQKSNLDIHERGIMYPRNLKERHDNLAVVLEEKENKETNIKLNFVFEKLKDIQIRSKGFEIFIPKSIKDFAIIGNALHNCVFSCNYCKDVVEDKSIILAVKKDNEFIECCELRKLNNSLRIMQLRGDHNKDSEYHEQAENIVNKFIGLYKKQNVALALGGSV